MTVARISDIGGRVDEFMVRRLARHPGVRKLHLAYVPGASELVQARAVLSEATARVISRGLSLRAATDLPFWDAVLVSSFGAEESMHPLLHAAMCHHPVIEPIEVDALRCDARVVEALHRNRAPNQSLALLSSVEMDNGDIAHWPMLDFHVPASDSNCRLALDALSCLKSGPGVLILSGQSYHFIGETLLTMDSLVSFLARALLLNPIVDRSWVAHQMLERRCALRISARAQSETPRVVARAPSSPDVLE